MEEYLQQITRLINLNGDSAEGMLVVNREGIVEYYKPGNAFGMLPGATCSRSTPSCRRRTAR